MKESLLALNGVSRWFSIRCGPFRTQRLKAVQEVTFSLDNGESLGLVGESGCGKSTVARLIAGLLVPNEGAIRFNGKPLAENPLTHQLVQMVFQDPHASLNPRRTIYQAVAEPLVIHRSLAKRTLRDRVHALLETVGLPGRFMYRYPHELSGGQKQRVAIARAVALDPPLLILDEPTSALDVSVQAQILEFLRSLRTQQQLAYLFISHNLSVVRLMCDRVAVMYVGRIVEHGPTNWVFEHPRHPYTQALLDAVPLPVAERMPHPVLQGDIPSPIDSPPGCAFHRRCPRAESGLCDSRKPHLQDTAAVEMNHQVACHRPNGS